MKLLLGLTILAAVIVMVYSHPAALDIKNDAETLESVDANAGVDSGVKNDVVIRKARAFNCGGYPYGGYRPPYGFPYGGFGLFGRPFGSGFGGIGFGSGFPIFQPGGFGFGK